MSTEDLVFAEMDSLNTLSKSDRFDLLPEFGTIRFSNVGGRGAVLSESTVTSEITATVDLTGARLTVSPYRSLLSQITPSSAIMASLYAGAMTHALMSLAQEWQKHECDRVKMLAKCQSLFKNTLKISNPFLPRQEIIIQPEIRERMESDEPLRRIVDVSISELSNALEGEDSYVLDVFGESDVEVPEWNENVIRVRIGTVSFENKIKLWESLEERVRSKIEEIRKQLPPSRRRKIDAINENLSIRLETEDL